MTNLLERDFGRRTLSPETLLAHAQFHIQLDNDAYWLLNDLRTALNPRSPAAQDRINQGPFEHPVSE